ncbi:putative ribonuclease H-like domain-containing protein [Tanacetum coccineum]
MPVTQTTTAEGGATTTTISSPVTAEEKIKKKNGVKARSILLMALPNEHLMTFNQYKDAKSLFAAIEIRFDGNEATKKTQKTLLKQIYENFNLNLKILRSLPFEWNTHIVVWGNKPDLDTMSIDDFYNNFKIVEQEVKGTASSYSSSQNMAFVSSPSTNSTNEVNIAYVLVLLALNLLVHEDLEQSHEDDLEEIDLKWQLALLSMREKRGPRNQDSINRYQDSSRRTMNVEETPSKAMVTIDEIGFDWSYMAKYEVPTNMALMDFSDSVSKNASEDIPNELKEYLDAPLLRVSDNKDCSVESPVVVEKKTVVPTIAKVEVGKGGNRDALYKGEANAPRNMVSRAVLMKTGLKPLNIVRLVNTVHPKTTVHINTDKGKFYTASPKAVNTARPKAVNTARPSPAVVNDVRANQGHPQKVQEDQGYVDLGCSRHMTGNMSYLLDFKEFNGGYVTFRGRANGGRITGKGTIKTGNLDFEDVYFVKELKFNLFSVSQMCDRKNNVLFTDTKCLVLSTNFKLPDKSQILLRVPRKNNMYSVDMKSIVPKESLTYLVAKATLDESMLWHRRLGHINFKIINKLVKDNLVRGLPSKHFENDQTCVACLKGKQHKASCMSKIQNSISQPLFMLHMDLFGPTFVSNLMHKKYGLVVTDDYSRYTWVFFLATKDETTGILKKFIIKIENLVDKKVKAEAVNTACYVQNRALVVKPHNKTPYKLFRGRTPALSFMRPFECHATILNTLDHLGKFDGKAYEGFFVRYSMNSKAFRVYNIRTKRVEENLHIKFLENKHIVAGDGPEWLFDIDMLTKSMNYVLVVKHDEVSDKESGASNELNSAFENLNTEYPGDPKMPGLDTIETYGDSKEEADFTNLESSIHVGN